MSKIIDMDSNEFKDMLKQVIKECLEEMGSIPNNYNPYLPFPPQTALYKIEKPNWMNEVICKGDNNVR